MKKLLLLSGLLAAGLSVHAQNNRLSLYEEFTGENCPPCASTNPGLWSLMTSGNNDSKIVLIKYQVAIPSAGTLSNQDPTDNQNRQTYYSVHFAPWGDMDGGLPPGIPASQQSANHPAYVTQAMIDQAAAVPAPFDIEIPSYTIENGQISASINITANTAISGSLRLRTALVETMHFQNAPGSNGEKDFENVVRKMYPGPTGQQIEGTWTANQTESYTISGAVPSYVDTTNEHMLVVWVQDDADKNVKQAAIAKDYATNGINDVVLNSNNLQIHPNPVIDVMNVSLEMAQSASVSFNITNILGQTMNVTNKKLNKGANKVELSTSSLASGVYFLNISNGSESIQRKFVKE